MAVDSIMDGTLTSCTPIACVAVTTFYIGGYLMMTDVRNVCRSQCVKSVFVSTEVLLA